MRDWVKRNWGVAIIALLAIGAVGFAVEEANTLMIGVMTTHAQQAQPKAQKPAEQPTIKWTNEAQVGAYQREPDIYSFTAGGTKIGQMDSRGNFTLTEPAFWKMIEQHCVTILPDMTVDQFGAKRELKLRCRPDEVKP